ncbi:MAG: FtsX-like permease family protein [Luteimonas sp.]
MLGFHLARPRDALLIAVGFLVATLTLSVLLAIPAGLDRLGKNTGRNDVAIAMSAHAFDEAGSRLSPEEVAVIGALPGIARTAGGRARVAPQFIASAKLQRRDGTPTTIQVRGVTADTWPVIGIAPPALASAEGRRALVPGIVALSQHPKLAADVLHLRNKDWRIADPLDFGGSLWESELWTELAALQAAYSAGSRISVLWLRLESASDYPRLAAAVAADSRLHNVRVVGQQDYYRLRLGVVSQYVRITAVGISLLLGLGASLCIGNALNTAIASRRRETATLRALGFRQLAIVLSALLDVGLIGLLAAAVALAIALLTLDGTPFSTASGGQAVYAVLMITPGVAASVLAYSIVLGLLSAWLPLWQSGRQRLVQALREH